MLFSGNKFLILPDQNAGSMRFLCDLIRGNGGIVVNSPQDLDPMCVVLINDTFVDESDRIIDREFFLKEFRWDPAVVWDFVLDQGLPCVKTSVVSQWLGNNEMNLSEETLLQVSFTPEPSTTGLENVVDSEVETDVDEVQMGPGTNPSSPPENISDTITVKPEAQSGALAKYIKDDEVKKNQLLIRALGKLVKKYEVKGDQFRARGYRLAKNSIEKYPHRVTSGKMAQRELANVGASIARKIQILLDTGTLPGLDDGSVDSFEMNVGYFSECYGIGIPIARKWSTLDVKSFKDATKLFPERFYSDWPILFGWTYYEDWSRRIKRDEVTIHFNIVRDELRRIDPKCSVEMQGSYIRGAKDTGDVDLMFYKEGCDDLIDVTEAMEQVAISLFKKGYIKCFLLLTSKLETLFRDTILKKLRICNIKHQNYNFKNSDRGKKLFFGVELPAGYPEYSINGEKGLQLKAEDKFLSQSKNTGHFCRRLDFFCCRWSELGAARIHYTGNTDYNRWLRVRAMDLGYKLTQHGIFKGNTLLESFDEEKIFQYLQVPYLDPVERNQVNWENMDKGKKDVD
ncbi:DNA polymerase IV [Nakaseomyces bracarensis]|uniref:DNA polymerase n=1 Tax=Nakaseomyces bracarensis TaxID=273131 RepID=A0ABR4NZ41_9SACH